MAVDIWPPRLKIANVGRTSPKKKKSTFFSKLHGKYQSPARLNCRWAERITKRKTNALSSSLRALSVKPCMYLSTHRFGSFRLSQLSREPGWFVRKPRVLPAWVRTRQACGTVGVADNNNSYDIIYVMRFSGRIGNVMLSPLLSHYTKWWNLHFKTSKTSKLGTRGKRSM